MNSERVASNGLGTAWDLVVRMTAADGSATHPHVQRLIAPAASARDLSDAVHAICALHGHHPGIVAGALHHCAQPDACAWLESVAEAMALERGAIVSVCAAVGPLPSTPGQRVSESALVASRHALEILAKSDRRGCATGAGAALVLDWPVMRGVVELAAARLGLSIGSSPLPPAADNASAITMLGGSPATERAIVFGAEQLLRQHRGLWDLLEARAGARAR